jgi:putative solute:sodium symporter small subunit
MSSTSNGPSPGDDKQNAYWVSSLRIVLSILGVWFLLSLGCGVLFREWLDSAMPNVGGAPFGFWMAQQGAIIGFLVLLFLYMVLMNALDRKHGFGQGDQE